VCAWVVDVVAVLVVAVVTFVVVVVVVVGVVVADVLVVGLERARYSKRWWTQFVVAEVLVAVVVAVVVVGVVVGAVVVSAVVGIVVVFVAALVVPCEHARDPKQAGSKREWMTVCCYHFECLRVSCGDVCLQSTSRLCASLC